MKKFVIIFIVLWPFLISAGIKDGSENKGDDYLRAVNLRVEYLANPYGIENKQPRLSWQIRSNNRGVLQQAYQIIVSSSPGKLNKSIGDVWSTKKIYSQSALNILYDGITLKSGTKYYWKVKVWDNKGNVSGWSRPSRWGMGFLNSNDWKAEWIGLDKAVGNDNPDTLFRKLSSRWLRKEFAVTKKIVSATAYISGLGLSELYLNGHKISHDVLSPALTDYSKRSLYVVYDVSKYIAAGQNAIGVVLGNGRFFAPRLYFAPNSEVKVETINYGFPKLIFQLEVVYTDGSIKRIVSDTTWKITVNGPITANNEYDGENYDARKEFTGWNKLGFNDSDWSFADKVSAPSEILSSQLVEPQRIMQTLKPKSVKKLKDGIYIYDMGQNITGWASIKVKAIKGTEIKLKFAESLTPAGELFTGNLRTAKQQDIYIAKGRGIEKWEPRFTYHGFRYVELTGYPGRPDLNTIEGKIIYNNINITGDFTCSNETINKIYKAACWTICGNYHGIPTDCPQRDERQGWLGDRSMNSYGESFVFDNNTLYSKWMTDISDAQRDSGSIPDIAPPYWPFYTDNMTWPSSFILIPENMYRQFGNLKIITDNYGAMKKWLFHMRDSYMKDYLLPKDLYYDWCIPPHTPGTTIWSQDSAMITPHDYLGSAYFYYCLKTMNHFANLLGNQEDAKEFSLLSCKVRDAINNSYFNKDSIYYANNTVTANVLALFFGITPDKLRDKVMDNIVKKVSGEYKDHISTGLIGCQWLMRTLTDNGRPDLAYKIASNKDYPGWGYMIENGATTIWELWNGNTGDPLMNSGNHVMLLGDYLIWCYENIAGIKTDTSEVGFKHIIMKPIDIPGLTSARASFKSAYGDIKSSWKKEKSKFFWDITIPANTFATIYIPAGSENSVLEGSKPLNKAPYLKLLKMEKGKAVIEIMSGSYHFISK